MASHGSDTPTSPRAVLHHKDTILCTFMHTTVTTYLIDGELIHDFLAAHILIVKPKKGQSLKRKALEKN